MQTLHPRRRLALCMLTLAAAATCAPGAVLAQGAGPGCAGGALACQDLGGFAASALRINITRKDGATAYQGVRTTVRVHNTGDKPLVLGYREGSNRISDDQGNVYTFRKPTVAGIGIVGRQGADGQFALAPGQAREFSLEGVLQYASQRTVAGKVFTHDFTLVEMQAVSATQLRLVRDHAVSFPELAATPTAQRIDAAAQLIDSLRKKH